MPLPARTSGLRPDELKMHDFRLPLMISVPDILAGAAPKAEADVLKLDRSFVPDFRNTGADCH